MEIKDCKNILQNVYKLACEYELFKDDIKLSKYLNALTFDEIKMVQTVMYIGRDHSSNLKCGNPDAVITDYMNQLENWGSREEEIGVINEKREQLKTYLQRAFTILGIE